MMTRMWGMASPLGPRAGVAVGVAIGSPNLVARGRPPVTAEEHAGTVRPVASAAAIAAMFRAANTRDPIRRRVCASGPGDDRCPSYHLRGESVATGDAVGGWSHAPRAVWGEPGAAVPHPGT